MRKRIIAMMLAIGMLLECGGTSEVAAAEQGNGENVTQESVTFSTYSYGEGLKHDPKYANFKKINGIDVSKYQNDINWKKVKKSGIEFAIIRVGYRLGGTGEIALDRCFKKNIEGAYKAGLDVGVYFYTQAINTKEAKEEAEFVVKQLKPYSKWISFPVYYDIENLKNGRLDNAKLTVKQKTKLCKAFCDTINKNGYVAGIYTYYLYYLQQLNMDELKKYDIWLARSSNEPSYKGKLFPHDYSMWQYYSRGRVDGINGNVDMDIFYVKSAPEKMNGLKQTAISGNAIALSWNASSNIDGYELVRMDKNGNKIETISTTETTYSLENLTNGTDERFKVRAYSLKNDGTKKYGDFSSTLKVRTLPGKVESVAQKECDSTSATIEWDVVEGASGYRIRTFDVSTQQYVTKGTTTKTFYKVTGLEPKETEQVIVQAYVNINGSTKKYGVASDSYMIVTGLDQIKYVELTQLKEDEISLTWDEQEDISGYEVNCYDEDSQLISTESVQEAAYTKKELESGKEYRFEVRSYLEMEDGEKSYGAYSDMYSIKTLPKKATGLKAGEVEDTSLKLTWDNVAGADGYCVYTFDTKKKKSTLLKTVDTNSCEITNLSASTAYSYKVAAYINVEEEIYNGELSSSYKVVTKETKLVKPVKVTGMKVTKVGTTSATISWKAQDKVSGYRIYLYDKKTKKSKFVKMTSKNSYTMKGLKPATHYYVKVKAYYKANGTTLYGTVSNSLSVKTK